MPRNTNLESSNSDIASLSQRMRGRLIRPTDSGSTLVARDTPAHIRIRVQGLTDAAFWSSAAAGSALAGVMLELTSYGWLALVATGLALLAIGLVAVQRRVPVPAGA